jgi:hypothetical protein
VGGLSGFGRAVPGDEEAADGEDGETDDDADPGGVLGQPGVDEVAGRLAGVDVGVVLNLQAGTPGVDRARECSRSGSVVRRWRTYRQEIARMSSMWW